MAQRKLLTTSPKISAKDQVVATNRKLLVTPPKKPNKLKSLFSKKSKKTVYTSKLTRAELINAESSLGRTLFGPIPSGHQREFFQSEKNVWLWHEGYFNEVGAWYEMTVRYEVRPAGVFKRVGRGKYEKLKGDELANFRHAAHSYHSLLKTHLYH